MTNTSTTPNSSPADDANTPDAPPAPAEATPAPAFTPGNVDDFEARLRAEWPGPHTTTTGEYFVAPEVSEGGWAETLILQAAKIAGEVFLGLTELEIPADDAQ